MALWQFIVLMAFLGVCAWAAETRDSKRRAQFERLVDLTQRLMDLTQMRSQALLDALSCSLPDRLSEDLSRMLSQELPDVLSQMAPQLLEDAQLLDKLDKMLQGILPQLVDVISQARQEPRQGVRP